MDKYWKMHGYPPRQRSNSRRKDTQANNCNVNLANADTNAKEHVDTRLTPEQFEKLMNLLSKQNNNEETKEQANAKSAHLVGVFEEGAFASW